MADVEALCGRVIVIHHGRSSSTARWRGSATVRRVKDDRGRAGGRRRGPLRGTATCSSEDGPEAAGAEGGDGARTARLLAERDVADLTVEEPPIEDVIELVFAQERPE